MLVRISINQCCCRSFLGISGKLEDFVISMALIATALSIWLLERAGVFPGHGFMVVPVSARVPVGDFSTTLLMVGSWACVHAGASNLTKAYHNHLKSKTF